MLRSASLVAALSCLQLAGVLRAQQPSANVYDDSLITQIRAAATAASGELPRDIRYLKFAEAPARLSFLVEGADSSPVRIAMAVFQISYPKRWIIVDAGFDRSTFNELHPKDTVTYWPERWARIQRALRGADEIVLTHEHWDHAVGVERGPQVSALAPKTLVTTEQLASLLGPPAEGYVTLSPDSVPPYHKIDYLRLYPVSAGVVLVKAPGHTPGSQWVYVKLASGREFLLVGDLVWNMAGLRTGKQRPMPVSQLLKEDRGALQKQIDFVRHFMAAGVTVVTSHDDSALTALVQGGLLRNELRLTRDH